MKIETLFTASLLLTLTGCKKADEANAARPTNQASASGNPITAPVDYLGAVAQAKKYSEKTINLVSVNNAIQQFNAMEERFPKDLNELIEKHYLQSVPAVPAGMRLGYKPQTGEVKIFKQP